MERTTAATVVGAAVATLVVYRFLGVKKQSSIQQKIWWSRLFRRYWLKYVRVPVAVLPGSLAAQADEEGLVECDILIQSGKIAAVEMTSKDNNSSFSMEVDCQGAIVLPCFSDAHTHLIKTETVPRNRNFSGTMAEALAAEVCDQPRWTYQDIVRRMEFAAACAVHYGTRAIRTHMDGCDSEDPVIQNAVFTAFDNVRDKYSDCLIVQGVANLYLPLWLTPMAREHADKAKTHENMVLGAYVGRNETGNLPDPAFVAAMDALFGHAQRLDMDVDMHIDESNDPQCCALASLCEALTKARKAGYTGRVVLGHCCALSLQSKKTQDRIVAQLAELKAYVVSNPFTNLGLQDRKGSQSPHSSVDIPADVPRTPQWRGLTLLQELRTGGVTVASASDNVRDHWYPYGDYDMVEVWKQTEAIGHLDTYPSEGAWADIITNAPAEAMGVPQTLAKGESADLVLFPNARRMSELFARTQADRVVLRGGRIQNKKLPDFCDLDDLVEVKTQRAGKATLYENFV